MERFFNLRHTLRAAALLAGLPLAAAAQNYVVNVSGSSGRTGERKALDVVLTKTDSVAGLNFTIKLPLGTDIDFDGVERDASIVDAAQLDYNIFTTASAKELRAILYSKATPPAAWYPANPTNQVVARVYVVIKTTTPKSIPVTIDNGFTTGDAIPVRLVGLSDPVGTKDFGTVVIPPESRRQVQVGSNPSVIVTGPNFTKVDLSFAGGPSGWLFREIFPGPFNTDPSTSPMQGSQSGASIGLKVVDPSKSFGFWTSPGSFIPATNLDTITLLKVSWPVNSTESDAANTPGFRLRLNAGDFTTAEVMTCDSPTNPAGGRLAPANSTKTFDMFVQPTDSVVNESGDKGYSGSFDLLNLDATAGGPANAAIRLSSVSVTSANVPVSGSGTTLKSWDFRSIGTAPHPDWSKIDNSIITQLSFISGETFPNTVAGSVNDGLVLTASNTNLAGGQFGFGFWGSNSVNFTAGAFYRVKATIASTTTDPAKTPHFRVRVNSEDNQWSRYMEVVQKSTDSSPAPATGEGTTYNLYFVYPDELAGVPARVYVDMVNDQTSDDASGSFRLRQLSIESLPIPTFN